MKSTRFSRFLAKRRLRKAAKLLRSGVFTEAEHAAIAVETIAILSGTSLRREPGWGLIEFAGEAHRILAQAEDSGALEDYDRFFATNLVSKYGPIGRTLNGLITRNVLSVMPLAYGADGRMRNGRLTWTADTDAFLASSHRHLRWWNRAGEAFDQWRGDQIRIYPNLHGDLWRGVWWVGSFLAGFLLRGMISR